MFTTPQEIGGLCIIDRATENQSWAQRLHGTVDGAGLVQLALNKPLNKWLRDPLFKITPGEYIKCVHVRLNCLKTPSRAARGRDISNLCRFDRQIGSLAHISQCCAITHGMRIKRHNKVVDMISKSIKKRNPGYKIAKEPRIPIHNTFCKPDLVIVDAEKKKAFILDPLITSDKVDMRQRFEQKVQLYHTDDTTRWLNSQFNIPERSMQVAGIILDFRGGFFKSSQDILRKLRVPAKYLEYLVVSTLFETWYAWNAYQCTN